MCLHKKKKGKKKTITLHSLRSYRDTLCSFSFLSICNCPRNTTLRKYTEITHNTRGNVATVRANIPCDPRTGLRVADPLTLA
ncbi:hypothetical protein PUN28_005696 [Cardiocondyla obscurior]|uniref:Uncharacterized protein n=1 Tax=Cardiocondyla obscurior TaxID=286306 RepID=A0AAW2G711_9HYME